MHQVKAKQCSSNYVVLYDSMNNLKCIILAAGVCFFVRELSLEEIGFFFKFTKLLLVLIIKHLCEYKCNKYYTVYKFSIRIVYRPYGYTYCTNQCRTELALWLRIQTVSVYCLKNDTLLLLFFVEETLRNIGLSSASFFVLHSLWLTELRIALGELI